MIQSGSNLGPGLAPVDLTLGKRKNPVPLFSGRQNGWQWVEAVNAAPQLANRFRQPLGIPWAKARRPLVELLEKVGTRPITKDSFMNDLPS